MEKFNLLNLAITFSTQVLISGYLDHSYSYFTRSIATSYLAKDRNVIIMDAFLVLLKPYPM